MAYGYSKRRIDNNHTEIIAELRREFGKRNVIDTHALPNFCDCVVGFRGRTYLIEIKSDKKSRLTKSEKLIDDTFDGFYHISTNPIEIIAKIYADNPF